MKNSDRELLILLPEDRYDDVALERQAIGLNEMLDHIDTPSHTVKVVEFLNLHRGGFTHNPLRIENALRRSRLGAFQFIIYKN